MKMTTAAAFYLMVSFLLPIAPTQAVQQYEVICLNDIQGASEPYPLAINNHGEIVGSDYAQYPSDTFLITPHFEYIKLTSNDQAHASAINNQGIIAGRYEQNAAILDPTGNDNHVQICTIPSSIQDINENNIAVGTIRVDNNNAGAFFNISGLDDYTPIGGIQQSQNAAAISINNYNQIVGIGYNGNSFEEGKESFAIAFDPSGNIHLTGLYGTYGSAWDINDNGIIIGESHILAEDPLMRATIFDPIENSAIDLGIAIDGVEYGYSGATSINNHNQIVGTIGGMAALFDATGQGNNINLNSLINPESGWQLIRAYDINDNGWIIGHGLYENNLYGYLLKPVPEPTTLLLVGIGAVMMRRRK